MTVCVSPGGRTASRGAAALRLLVGTVDGVCELIRPSAGTPWATGARTLAGSHISALVRLADGATIVAGAHSGGLWVSRDDGRTWASADAGIASEHRHVFTIHARERDGATALFAGTQPVALYRSDDLGRTWRELPALRDVPGQDRWSFPAPPHEAHVKFLTSHPAEPATLYACVEQGALLRSRDDGASWNEISSYAEAGDVWYHDAHRIVFGPSGPHELYFTSGEGLYHSVDAGVSWTHLTRRRDAVGYPDALFLDPSDARTVYLSGSPNSPDAWLEPGVPVHPGFLRSRDGGATWERLDAGLPARVGGTFEALAMHDAAGGPAFYAGTCAGEVFASEDGGHTWRCAAHGLPPVSKVGHYKKFPVPSPT